MKLFAAIAKKEALEVARDIGYRNILVSYFYIKKRRMLDLIRSMNGVHEFFLDSGAHSANTIGAKITREELTSFAKENLSLFKIYAGLDDDEQALAWLNKSYVDRSNNTIFLNEVPQFDNLRSKPSFQNLRSRIGL